MPTDLLSEYIGIFGHLHRNQNPRWGGAPHKPVLLLAVLDEMEHGRIAENRIELTLELILAFRDYWRVLVTKDTWQQRIANPFRYMVHEGFWELVKNGFPVSMQSLGMNPSIRQLTAETDGAVLASDLWELLQDRNARSTLRNFLLERYFSRGVADVQPCLHSNPLDYEAEKLKAEAHSKFRPKQVREDRDETGYYVRHALFPTVIRSLYNDSCAVCRLNVQTEDGRALVDAAHIMPFSLFHYDDPRNGLSLCKNHHWGFDAGWFTATADYKILISPFLKNAVNYLPAGVSLLLPTQIQYAPASEALAWHQQHVYKK
jgi:putative restriction endonuclease